MKRFLILLAVVAGGLALSAHSIPKYAAVVNGIAITQQKLNGDVTAIARSADYQCYLNAEEYLASNGQGLLPPVDGAGQFSDGGLHTSVTMAFTASFLDTAIGHQLVLGLAEHRHVVVTSQAVASARNALVHQITLAMTNVLQTQVAANPRVNCGLPQPLTGTEVLATMPTSFVDEEVHFDATVGAFEEVMAGVGSTQPDLQSYFNHHRPMFDTSCITVAFYTSASAAQAASAKVAAGTPFVQVASQAPQGGPRGCGILSEISSVLPTSANLSSLPLNTLSAPIPYNGQYLLLEITRRSTTPYATAQTAVERAVQAAGALKFQRALYSEEKAASVTVDPRYGRWVINAAQVLVPLTPVAEDVLNPSVNSPSVTSASASPLGAPSTSTGQSG
jgi:hypothetical protein